MGTPQSRLKEREGTRAQAGAQQVQRPWCSRPVWPEQRKEAGGQGQRSHGASGLAKVKPLVPGSAERLILLTEGWELA